MRKQRNSIRFYFSFLPFFLQLSLFLLLLLAISTLSVAPFRFFVSAAGDDVDNISASSFNSNDDGFAKLVAWMKENGGRVDNRIDVGITNGILGIVALDDIEEGAILLFSPWKLIIGSSGINNEMKGQGNMRQVVQSMAKEIRLGADSFWFPYLNRTHIGLPRLPSAWGQPALVELQGLPPSQNVDQHVQWFQQACEGELDSAVMRSLVGFISRANSVGMTPIYDLLNHHNGKQNAKQRRKKVLSFLLSADPSIKDKNCYFHTEIRSENSF